MQKPKVRVAIAGVGNCASALVQGTEYYRTAEDANSVPGLMHATLGGYHISDIEFSAAFDIDRRKVGRDLAQSVFAAPNNTHRFCKVPDSGVEVLRGPTLDGRGKYLEPVVEEDPGAPVDVATVLRATATDVLVCYLPVGSQAAAEYYAEQALAAGCGMVNCIPVFLASDPVWAARFRDRRLPIIGDDIKSQVGATIVHRLLANLMRERGVRLDRTYQLNFGGNTDFLNMLERERLDSKKISKTNSVTSQIGHALPEGNVHIGPSDYVPWLEDRKFCYIRVEGTTFGDVPLGCELKLEVWDSPNSAGVVIDAVRCVKLAMDRSWAGPLTGPSSYFMKSPPVQFTDAEARERTEAFIEGEPIHPHPDMNGHRSPKCPDSAQWGRHRVEQRVRELGTWFQNLELNGVQTAPNHFLGDYPAVKWHKFADAIPADLSGKSVLDIGCNAGFYSLEMKRRGAFRVLGIDVDERYLTQARFAAEVSGLDIDFQRLSVYDIAHLEESFDLVLFMGVFYHLRHPLLALDLIHEHAARDLLVFQSMQRGSEEVLSMTQDHLFEERKLFDHPGYPKLHFIEHRYCGDPTNWWVPNRACTEAMLRSSGFEILSRAEEEVYLCRWREMKLADWDHRTVYPARATIPEDPSGMGLSTVEEIYD